ncbi:hypothetical protein LB506_002261 [Fusarium annulatum]|nr:hypothetical protein LB506_002261 [Fusarium annulatum]
MCTRMGNQREILLPRHDELRNAESVLGSSARFHGERSAVVDQFDSLILGNLGQSRAVPNHWGTDSGTRLGGGGDTEAPKCGAGSGSAQELLA